jgi:Right handed beta helix region
VQRPAGQASIAPCSTVASSVAAAQSSLAAASAGQTVCLADGKYPKLTLSARKSSEVVVRARNPGKTTIAGASLDGANITLARFVVLGAEVTVRPGARGMTIADNRISRGYFGVNAGPTTTTPISDTTIRGNEFKGPFGEDAIRANRYHDGPDADRYGMLVEGNEFTGVRENGKHSDCFQSVWGGDGLYFRRNYLHDNRCQGLFVKDQPTAVRDVVVEDNLMVRNSAPCAGSASSSCGPPSVVSLFGPMRSLTLRRNTVWTSDDGSPVALRPGLADVTLSGNVIYRVWADGDLARMRQRDNAVCRWETAGGGSLPPQAGAPSCSPPFADPAHDDFRLPDGGGVDWSPRGVRFGP